MPEDDLISKKDLLAATGISYGQLYRWKRKDLIPEEWFVRRSTYTGQETFFPRRRMLERVARIQELMRDDVSLDAIAELLSPSPASVALTREDAVGRGLVTPRALGLLERAEGETSALGFEALLQARIAEELLADDALGAPAAEAAVRTLRAAGDGFAGRDALLLLARTDATFLGVLAPASAEPVLDPTATLAARLPLPERMERLKTSLELRGAP